MQLGSRWRAGEPPHRGVPELLHDAIAASELAQVNGVSWTLTWLEGRPRVELFDGAGERLDDLRVDASGEVTRSETHSREASINLGDDDDDWLM